MPYTLTVNGRAATVDVPAAVRAVATSWLAVVSARASPRLSAS